MERDSAYINHVSDAISIIESYSKGLSFKSFLKNRLIQDGIIRQLEIIGEATKRLSADLKNSHKEVPWKDIAGMRDKLIHDYLAVDLEAVWRTAKKDIPELKKVINKIKISKS